jgi:AcrR family transcriptional regulator
MTAKKAATERTDREESVLSPRSAGTRTAILDAARDLFNRHGFKKVSVSDIATAAHLTRPTVYAYFKGKDEILNAVIEREGTQVLEAGLRSLDDSTVAPEQIATLYNAVDRHIKENSILQDIASRDLDVLTPEVLTIAMGFETKMTEALASIIEQGMEEGTIVQTDPYLMAYVMVRIHEAFNFTPLINLKGYNRQQLNEFIFGLMARMLAPSPGENPVPH